MKITNTKSLLKDRKKNHQVLVKPTEYKWLSKQAVNNNVSRNAIIKELIRVYKKHQSEKK